MKGSEHPHYGKRGPKNPNWKGGKSRPDGYNWEFDTSSVSGKELQTLILERDNYECQDCGRSCLCSIRRYKRMFSRHHLDGDKTNNNPENLVLLCMSCHKSWDKVSLIYPKRYET